jgi:YfiH family protein
MITVGVLDGEAGIRHAFFTRQGGVSGGLFDSLNCGFGSGDDGEKVAHNRAIAMGCLDLVPDSLVTCYQIHSASVVTVTTAWRREDAPRADAMVTREPGIALGVLAADCTPVLFADREARIIGAAHAGWRGAIGGVLDATVARMEALGAARARIRAGIGPCIAQGSYEVGAEFEARFVAEDADNARFFVRAPRAGHALFDLGAYIDQRLARLGVATRQRAAHDTVVEEDRFFSYRRACHRGEAQYGRGLSAIVLER